MPGMAGIAEEHVAGGVDGEARWAAQVGRGGEGVSRDLSSVTAGRNGVGNRVAIGRVVTVVAAGTVLGE